MGQAPNPAEVSVEGKSNRRATAAYIESGPVIDGKLDDAVWKQAVPASDFVQHEPYEGRPATERTEVYLLYTQKELFVGVMCHDSEPSRILVTQSERDSDLTNTDSFWMVFDTFRDTQNGFVFGTNPLGLEFDAQISQEGQGGTAGGPALGSRTAQAGSGGGLNKNWDGNWEVATSITEEGWVAEFRIPFSTLRFQGSKQQVWGVNFARNIRRRNEQDYWSPVPRQWDLYRLTMAGELHGLGIEPPVNFIVTPYFIGSIGQDFEGNPLGDAVRRGDTGVDVKYGLTGSLTLDLTYNTDFAQVEVDEQQVNLTRFNLFFPEKRPFFLENAGLFAVGSPRQVDLFFSRRIGIDRSGIAVPILGGARLSGKAGRWNLGFLNMQTEEVGDCAVSRQQCLTPGNNFSVARINREIGARSSVGGIFINKEASGTGIDSGNYNRIFGLDTRIGIGEAFRANGYFAKTATFREQLGEEAFDGSDYAFSISGEHSTRVTRFNAGYREVGRNFNPEVGFLQRRAYRSWNAAAWGFLRPDWPSFREARPHVTYTAFYNLEGFKESDNLHMDSHFDWENGTHFSPAVNITFEGLKQPFQIFPGVTVPPGEFRNAEIAWRYNSNLSAPVSVDAGVDAGGLYRGTQQTYFLGVNARKGGNFNASVSFTHTRVDLPIEGPLREFGGKFDFNLVRARINYSFTPRMFLQSLLQYNEGGDNWSTNLRFGWLNTAGTGLFIVYSETQDIRGIDLSVDPLFRRSVLPGDSMGRSLVIKFTREFRPF
ncbi:MAG: carbohydrate binding family 9 domain-containing protein [Acidobacteria bacterium]|nr:carbohydrate binding family 9 domain-containing protein [Acidobacteriota bacterium]